MFEAGISSCDLLTPTRADDGGHILLDDELHEAGPPVVLLPPGPRHLKAPQL